MKIRCYGVLDSKHWIKYELIVDFIHDERKIVAGSV